MSSYINLILNHYPELLLKANRKGFTPYLMACKKGCTYAISLFESYYPKEILMSAITKDGFNALHIASFYGQN